MIPYNTLLSYRFYHLGEGDSVKKAQSSVFIAYLH